MKKAQQQAWRESFGKQLRVVETVHVQNRPRGGGAWYVCIVQVHPPRGTYAVTVTRHYRGPLPPPADWNPKRTEIVLGKLTTPDAARRVAEGFVLGKWGRWTI